MISTNTIIIHWLQGWWKTLFASIILWFSSRLLTNFDILHNWKILNDKLIDIQQLKTLKFSYKAWFLWIDEIARNFNSKSFTSDRNKTLSDLFFIIRKFNYSSLFVTQRYMSVPVDIRDLATIIFKVEKHYDKYYKKWLFTITSQERFISGETEILVDLNEEVVDLIWLLWFFWFSYNTLESSVISW